ncbi:hypothetical protein [Streptomyces roseoverticillatus]|uniref:Uncharacterized protein n=1 Tax=Streptomyces roseoverticillatus TaxID=66429 RepID=A0ABV3J6H4_9ACTN
MRIVLAAAVVAGVLAAPAAAAQPAPAAPPAVHMPAARPAAHPPTVHMPADKPPFPYADCIKATKKRGESSRYGKWHCDQLVKKGWVRPPKR